jgi:hypothetical protein
MGKRKSKKRKNKLARPPKKKTPKAGVAWEYPVAPPEFEPWEELGDEAATSPLDAPSVPWHAPRSERPFGAVDPSMRESTRYRKFRDTVAAIREAVPESRKSFATYDVPDLALRRWLTRYCSQKEAGKLADWQQVILEKAGFNWKRGRCPVKKAAHATRKRPPGSKAKPTNRKTERDPSADSTDTSPKGVPPREAAWTEACEALDEACAATSPDLAMQALLRVEERLYRWLHKQVLAARSDKLEPERRQRLQGLPFDFERLIAERDFSRWRKAFNAYAAGELENADNWAAKQAKARKAGDLPEWRIKTLNTIGFDWEKAALSPSQLKMEARWRRKLEHYLKLKATHGGPLPMAHPAVKPLRSWLSRMRECYKKGILRPELVAEFEAKGFEFSGMARFRENQEREWKRQFDKLVAFKARFGHARVPSSYADDPEFGAWLAHQRENWKLGKLKDEKIAKFRELGVEPTYKESSQTPRPHLSAWLKRYRKLLAFLRAEHNGRLPKAGRLLEKDRQWLKRQRDKMQSGQMEPWQIEKLDAIDFNPEALPGPPPPIDWEDRMARLRRFVKEHGHARVARSCPDKKLYRFVQTVRKNKRQGKLSPEQEREFQAIGFSFDPGNEVTPAWMRQYEALLRYYQEHGHCQMPRYYSKDKGLAEFVAQQKRRGHNGMLLAEHIRLLNRLDFPWTHGQPRAKDQ